MKYHEALKLWNSHKHTSDTEHSWISPKKGTQQYKEVQFIVRNNRVANDGEDIEPPAKAKKARAPKAKKARAKRGVAKKSPPPPPAPAKALSQKAIAQLRQVEEATKARNVARKKAIPKKALEQLRQMEADTKARNIARQQQPAPAPVEQKKKIQMMLFAFYGARLMAEMDEVNVEKAFKYKGSFTFDLAGDSGKESISEADFKEVGEMASKEAKELIESPVYPKAKITVKEKDGKQQIRLMGHRKTLAMAFSIVGITLGAELDEEGNDKILEKASAYSSAIDSILESKGHSLQSVDAPRAVSAVNPDGSNVQPGFEAFSVEKKKKLEQDDSKEMVDIVQFMNRDLKSGKEKHLNPKVFDALAPFFKMLKDTDSLFTVKSDDKNIYFKIEKAKEKDKDMYKKLQSDYTWVSTIPIELKEKPVYRMGNELIEFITHDGEIVGRFPKFVRDYRVLHPMPNVDLEKQKTFSYSLAKELLSSIAQNFEDGIPSLKHKMKIQEEKEKASSSNKK